MAKKSRTFRLSDATNERLRQLAERFELNESQVIEAAVRVWHQLEILDPPRVIEVVPQIVRYSDGTNVEVLASVAEQKG